jgi:hypothetical protein
MPERGRPIEFGDFLIPNADEYPELVEQAERTDRLGLDYIGIQDHPYQRRFLDTFARLVSVHPRREAAVPAPDGWETSKTNVEATGRRRCFVPVVHPTLRTGVETLMVAARAWLSS